MTSTDTRIQLEGQLEIVEAALARLRTAVASLSDDANWLSDARWRAREDPRLPQALAACRKRVATSTSIERCFSELTALRSELNELARSRLRDLRLPVGANPLATLESHVPLVVHPDRVRRARPRLWFDANPSPGLVAETKTEWSAPWWLASPGLPTTP